MGTPCYSFLLALLFFIIPFVVPDVEARKFDNGLATRPGPWKPVTAMTENGPVVGYQNASSRVWKGIPYAAPPIGKLRWQDPQPPQPWGPSPLPAFDYKPACPQHCHLPPGFCATNQSEDCLHLNVWTPSELGNTPLPVMVFFAGGAFFQGDGGVPVYSGDLFVNITNTVLVTCSYRLGALGFLVTDTFTGNFGIKDQREVLKWVARNIKNFGGDPNSITVFGESAGAQSIGVHLASPLSAGLFHRAIMESNPFSLEFKHTIAAQGDAAALASLLDCDFSDVNCWLSKTADEIVDAQGKVFIIPPSRFDLNILLQWTPTIDGDQLPMQPLDALVAGKFNKVPIILGSNSNEGVLFVYQIMSKPLTPLEYSAIVALLFREDALEVWEKYSVSFSSNDARMAFAQLLTEYLFGCSTRKAAQGASAAGVPTYLYYYDHPLSFNGYGPNYQYCVGYVCHGCELPLVFDSARESGFNFTTGEAQLSLDIMHYWTNFAKSPNGDPNYGNNVNVAWPTFDVSSWQDAWLKVPVEQQQNLLKDHCDMWDRLGYNW